MTLIKSISWIVIVGALCFIPWVWTLIFGILVYFPYEANGSDRFMRTTGPLIEVFQKGKWATAHEIPRSCNYALIAAEDARFYQHFGIDIESIKIAKKRNEKNKTKKFGASTITQQIVKNAFLSRDKTYIRKAREMIGAILLDLIMSKEKQMVWYFNIVEFGPSLYGIKDAARYYFNKTPAQLTKAECTSLVSLLPNPRRLSAFIKKGRS